MQKKLGILRKASIPKRDIMVIKAFLVLRYESIWEVSIYLHAFLADSEDVNKYLMDGLCPV